MGTGVAVLPGPDGEESGFSGFLKGCGADSHRGGEPVLFCQPRGEDILRSPQILGCRLPEEMKQTHTNTQRHTNTHTHLHIRAHTHPSVGKLVLWVLWAGEQGRFIISAIACTPQGWKHTEVISSPSDDLKIPVSVHFENTPHPQQQRVILQNSQQARCCSSCNSLPLHEGCQE